MINLTLTEEEAAALAQMLTERRDLAAAVANTAHGLLQKVTAKPEPQIEEVMSSPDAMRG